MNQITIETLTQERKIKIPHRILAQEGIAMAAIGSLACIRDLYFHALELGKTDFFFSCPVSARDYSLGKQEQYIAQCIQNAVEHPEVRGVIVYASCLDILSLWDFSEILFRISNPRNIPVEVLYRGPLVKRKNPPGKALQEIWKKWGIVENTDFHPVPLSADFTVLAAAPAAPDFEGIISLLQPWDWDILLLSAGGCKNCLNCIRTQNYKRVKSTRFSDISLSNLKTDMLAELIADSFPEDRPLCLLGTAVIETIGLDIDGLCEELRLRKKEVIYLESNGFEPASPAMEKAWLTIGKTLLSKRNKIQKGTAWILGYSSLTVTDRKDLDRCIDLMQKQDYQISVWTENSSSVSNGTLPERNIVISPEGMPLAMWMEKKWRIPFQSY